MTTRVKTENRNFIDQYWDSPLPINEAYTCIQGEGGKMGVASMMIRFTGCRLRCQFANSACDTWYSSWKPEKGHYTLAQLRDLYESNHQINHTIITGGGPTLFGDKLRDLIDVIKYRWNHHVTIETEGSEYVDTNADLISLSPKLSNSTPKLDTKVNNSVGVVKQRDIDRHEKWRKNYSAMRDLCFNHDNFQLKFVVSDLEAQSLKEIDDTVFEILGKHHREYANNVWLMPEGETQDRIQALRRKLMEYCIKRGFNYSDRLHIMAYGLQRGV